VPYVALDLETTGLDPETDEIIEVAAIRFDADGAVLGTYSTLVNPGRGLDYRIARLTHIPEADLRRAPHFGSIALEVEEFLGFDPVVGQNPLFDLAFLARKGVQVAAPAFDTFELAALLLPDLRQLSLGAIADHLGIAFAGRHRAFNDAEAAMRVFVALRRILAESPRDLLAEADRLAALSDWSLRHLLREVASEHPRQPGDGARDGFVHRFVRAPSPLPERRPATASAVPADGPAEIPPGVDPDEAADLLASAGAREALDGYEERSEQRAMARAVAETVAGGGQLLVEAGTGVGKSLAYIVPAALHAARTDTRAVISTNTINLQEQLVGQDIPVARRILQAAGIAGDDLRIAVLKGRRNYLCLLRWAAMQHAPALSSEEARVLVRLLFWLGRTETGDRAEINLHHEDAGVWSRLSAQDGGCLSMQCAYVRDGSCFLYRARRRAEASHLLVVNHALLLSDLAASGNVLPEYHHLIVDEAHHLEDEATRQFGFTASLDDLLDWLDGVAGARGGRERDGGIVATVRDATRASQQALGLAPQAQQIAASLTPAVAAARRRLREFFAALQDFGRNHASGRTDTDERIRINRGIRVQPDWSDIEAAWFQADELLAAVTSRLEDLQELLGEMPHEDLLDHDAVVASVGDALLQGERLRAGISRIIGKDEHDTVCWLTLGRRDASPSLSSAPLSVAETLSSSLFGPRQSVVLTSATLSADGRFDYVKGRLGVPDARELLLGSPFDYRASTLLLAPSDMPEPDQHGYLSALQTALVDLAEASGGRALALFTSHASLRAAYAGIKPQLAEREILVLAQELDGSPKQLLAALREDRRTLVLGAASFWEGVDITGEALSLLVIARLPFAVPTDPVYQARSELFEQPFDEYALPQAILRFKQGFGRLIRRKTDRGVVVVLDRRLRSRQYGDTILRSLPACDLREPPLRDLAAETRAWLAGAGALRSTPA